jgi:hypothetical protein
MGITVLYSRTGRLGLVRPTLWKVALKRVSPKNQFKNFFKKLRKLNRSNRTQGISVFLSHFCKFIMKRCSTC